MGIPKGSNGRAVRRVLCDRVTLADLDRLDEHIRILRAAASGTDGVGLVADDTREFIRSEVLDALGHLGCAFADLADASHKAGLRKVEHGGRW
jgi:hypothetical protein